MSVIYPLRPLNNRENKRKYINEVKKISSHINDIQVKFELAIFEAPKELTYKEIYDYFLDEWLKLVDKIIKVYRLRYCFIDLHYFERHYKSIV